MAKQQMYTAMLIMCAFVAGMMAAPDSHAWVNDVPPCSDDSGASEHAVCYWDATEQGDGVGDSFFSLNNGEIIVYKNGYVAR